MCHIDLSHKRGLPQKRHGLQPQINQPIKMPNPERLNESIRREGGLSRLRRRRAWTKIRQTFFGD
jgi:hypothetical protein